MGTFQISLGGLIAWIANKVKKTVSAHNLERDERIKKIETTNEALIYAIRVQQKESIYKSTEKYLVRGFITLPELDTLNSTYKSYKSLGGDDSTDLRVERCKELPLHESSDAELDSALHAKGLSETHKGIIHLGGKQDNEI